MNILVLNSVAAMKTGPYPTTYAALVRKCGCTHKLPGRFITDY